MPNFPNWDIVYYVYKPIILPAIQLETNILVMTYSLKQCILYTLLISQNILNCCFAIFKLVLTIK